MNLDFQLNSNMQVGVETGMNCRLRRPKPISHTFVAGFLLDDSYLELASNDVKRFFEYNPDLELFGSTLGLSLFCIDGPDSKIPDSESHFASYGINQDGRCITWNSECLLWLRPGDGGNSYVVSGSTMCIRRASVRVLFFAFDSAVLSQAIVHSGLATNWSLSSA